MNAGKPWLSRLFALFSTHEVRRKPTESTVLTLAKGLAKTPPGSMLPFLPERRCDRGGFRAVWDCSHLLT